MDRKSNFDVLANSSDHFLMIKEEKKEELIKSTIGKNMQDEIHNMAELFIKNNLIKTKKRKRK